LFHKFAGLVQKQQVPAKQMAIRWAHSRSAKLEMIRQF